MANTQLKTRISELEVINIMQRESENRLRSENKNLNERLSEVEKRLKELEAEQQPAKKPRLSEVTTE